MLRLPYVIATPSGVSSVICLSVTFVPNRYYVHALYT